jgi:type II secretory pathway predicted ATPase ExeA
VDSDASSGRAPSYERFFGFRQSPFSLAPDVRFRFQSASHAAALAQITYALERREPVVVVTGEIGTGKTLLCKTVIDRMERRTFLSIINDPMLGRDDFLKRILQDFGVISKDRTVATPSRHDLVHALQEFVASLAPLQAHAAVIIDEAQHTQPDVLEQIRLVSNVQDEHGTMLQIILVGQNDLDPLLSRPELEALKQRVARSVRLDPLSDAEVAQYIEHRLMVARTPPVQSGFPGAQELQRELSEWDGMSDGVTFTAEAIGAVAEISRGIPRIVNLLCDRALETAYARRSRAIDASSIDSAAGAIGLPVGPRAAAIAAPSTEIVPGETAAIAAGPLEHDWAAPAPAESPTAAPAPADRLPVWGLPTAAPADDAAIAAPASHTRRNLLAAAVVVLSAVALWLGARAMFGSPSIEESRQPPPQPASSRPASPTPPPAATGPAPAASAPAATTPPSSAGPAAAAAAPSSAAPPPSGAGARGGSGSNAEAFEIVVASFRTAIRATDVAAAVAQLGEPVRQRAAGGWEQVLTGPYPSREQALDAQARLERAGFTGTHLVPATR